MNLHGRPTQDRKGESIRIRLNDEMRMFIDHKSRTTGKSISQIFRDYVATDMRNTFHILGGSTDERS